MPKIWLITGSSGGLGRTIAEAALGAGDKVLATAREPARLEDLVHRFGSRIRTVQHDVRDASAAATAVQIAVDAFDRIDVWSMRPDLQTPRLKTSASRALGFLWRPISLVSLS